MPRSAPPTLPGAARARRTVRCPADPATISMVPTPMRLVPAIPADAPDGHTTNPSVGLPQLRFNPDALLPRHDAATDYAAGALAGLAAAAATTRAYAEANADAGWAFRRTDDRGRVPAREIAATTPNARFVATAKPGMLLLTPADQSTPATGLVRVRGARLCLPATLRLRAGLPAPGDVILIQTAQGWAVLAASTLRPLLAVLTAQIPDEPLPEPHGAQAPLTHLRSSS